MAMACGCNEFARVSTSERKIMKYSSSLGSLFLGLVVAAMMGTSSSFTWQHGHTSSAAVQTCVGAPPRSSSLSLASRSYIRQKSSLFPAVSCSSNMVLISFHARVRVRGKIRPRSTSLFVSLGTPTASTVSSESDELTEGINIRQSENVTFLDTLEDLTIKETTSVSAPIEAVIPPDETDQQHHRECARMGEEVEELTSHLLAPDELESQKKMLHLSPSIPISYDDHGMAQAEDISHYAHAVPLGAVVMSNSNGSQEQDYPPFITFLFQKDTNGQTLASKLFNFALLVASFGFVFSAVFNIDRGMTRGWSPAEIGMRIPLDTWASYENSLSEKPVATKTIINIVIYLLGDWLSQTIFQSKNILDFDAARTLKNGFIGMCFGPVVHEYYEYSDWILPVDGVTIGITNRAFKILMDQTIYLSVKCSIYILAIGVLNGDGVGGSSENVKNRIKPIMFAAWKFWPLVHCVTYGLIPARHRILWVNSVDLVWNAILASKARDDSDGEDVDSDGGLGEGMDVKDDVLALSGEEEYDMIKF